MIVQFLAVIFQFDTIAQERLSMFNDYANLAALLLFLGGVLFWLILLFLAFVGVARGISRLYDVAADTIESRRNPARIPHIES